MSTERRILIITAAFGEGHNSAARNLALALEAAGGITQVSDPCMLGAPRLTGMVNRAYRYVTTNFPSLWAWIYRSTDRCDLGQQRNLPFDLAEAALEKLVAEFQPTAIVSTYPLYPYFLSRIFLGGQVKPPVFVVVTDSIEINAAWLRAQSDWWLVTDAATREAMESKGLAAEKLVDTGFPVNPVFSELPPFEDRGERDAFQVLYFPTAKSSLVRHARALLEASPAVCLTMVMGRNARRLCPQALKIRAAYPGRVRLIGWTRRVPQLLSRHHLVVGKAGGATVHEAIAARCPMLIHHLVPGQEEGNLRLLEMIGGGHLADSPEALIACIRRLLANDSAAWRAMKEALVAHNRNAGAIIAARFILDQIERSAVTGGPHDLSL